MKGKSRIIFPISRRSFLQFSSVSSLAASSGLPRFAPDTSLSSVPAGQESKTAGNTQEAIREFLKRMTCRREEVEVFLDATKPHWARFDPELGYTLRDNILKDGVDGSRTIFRFEKSGERKMINYADRPCRINTYGDSFTMCQQVNDGETWQESLAAHFGEPIRNFGIGGYGVYQAYRRMLREEAGSQAAPYLILNILGIDDHLRNVDTWRWLRYADRFRKSPGHLFEFLGPWVYVRLDLDTGRLIEKENEFKTPESLRQLADPEFVYEHFKNDLVVKLLVAENNGGAADREELEALAKALNVTPDLSSPEAIAATAHAVHLQYGLRATTLIVEQVQAFARGKNKKLLILLSYGAGEVMQACEEQPRPDQVLIDFLKERGILFADSLTKHVQDFKAFNVTPRQYADRYYIGHYKPQGYHFFAFAIKDALVGWLDPRPLTYREGSETIPAVV